MSGDDIAARRETLADAFGQDTDPLAEFETTFRETGIDPFDLYLEDVVENRSLADNTFYQYRTAYAEWREFMDLAGRHPACPTEDHVKRFARWQLGAWNPPAEWTLGRVANHPSTVKEKLRKIGAAYQYWQAESAFPHPQDYDPVQLAREKLNFEAPETKDFHRLSLADLRERIRTVYHVRDRAIIAMQLKLGLRAGELCNIRLDEVSLSNRDVRGHYEAMGTNDRLAGRENAVYIPHDREGNKSKRPRVLPLDDETRQLLLRYLLIRPDNGEPWVFLSTDHHEKLGPQGVTAAWKSAFFPEYGDTEEYRGVTSHFGRHFFSTYWRVQQDLNRELVKYMRGDTTDSAAWGATPDVIDTYLHAYYEDIEDVYREHIFKLGL